MSSWKTVEELVIDDSFISYCLEKETKDILYWENYLQNCPDQKKVIDEAKQIVLVLTGSLINAATEPAIRTHSPVWRSSALKIGIYAAACAVVFFAIYIGFLQMNGKKSKAEIVSNIPADNPYFFATLPGSKQTIMLPDGTTVYLNSSSTLELSKGFGKTDRKVFLVGEGGFDVNHNTRLPFIVSVEKYDVNVTGTFFNVKAYPGEKTSETSLLRGKVDIMIKEGRTMPVRMTLKPNQKFILDIENKEGSVEHQSDNSIVKENTNKPHVVIDELTYNRDSLNIETAWMNNTLIIDNETFELMKEKLERWYNVRIIFRDNQVKKYGFTGTFKHESISQVLKAFQDSYYFKYTIEGKDITISAK